jgi:hypothetical protein
MTSVPHDASSATVRFETTGLFAAASNHPIIHPTFPTRRRPPLPSRNAARATIAKRLISLKPGARNPPDLLRHNKKPRRSGAKSAMWAAEKGGGNAAHTETLPQKRLPAQAGNVIQLRCEPTSRQFSVRPSARESPAGAGLHVGHACRLAWAEEHQRGPAARHTKTPCPQRARTALQSAAGDGRRIERYADCMVARIMSIGPWSRHCPLLRFGRGKAQEAAVMPALSDTRELLVSHLSLAAGHTLTMSPRLLAAGATLAPVKERSRVQVTLGAEVRHQSSSPWNDTSST